MGMRTSLYALREEQLRRVLAQPTLVDSLLQDEPGSRAAAALPRRECDVDKAWQAIDFVLTGTVDETSTPLGFLICGGQDIGEDLGYGPARAFEPRDVASIAEALEPITLEEFAKRFDHPALLEEGVYAMENEDDDREYVFENFAALRAFVAEAKDAGEGIIIALL
jgi:hypothetical protein